MVTSKTIKLQKVDATHLPSQVYSADADWSGGGGGDVDIITVAEFNKAWNAA